MSDISPLSSFSDEQLAQALLERLTRKVGDESRDAYLERTGAACDKWGPLVLHWCEEQRNEARAEVERLLATSEQNALFRRSDIIVDESLPPGAFALVSDGKRHVFQLPTTGEQRQLLELTDDQLTDLSALPPRRIGKGVTP